MKKLIKAFKVLLPLLLLAHTSLFAQIDNDNDVNRNKNYEFIKTKSVNKSYTVSSSDKLNIQNIFGDVRVHTWDKNEIKVDIAIKITANTEKLAQKLLDQFKVKDSRNGADISFKTYNEGTYNTSGQKSSITVDYEISMPSTNPLNISNEFGAITLPDFRGEVDLSSKFGSLTAGNLSSIKNIHVEFGKVDLANINSAPVTIKFSKVVISKLSGVVKMNLDFCNSVELNLDNNLSSLDLKTTYSTVNLKPLGNLSAAYNISTSFGSFKNTSDVKFESDADKESDGPKFDFEYSGKSGNGSIPVKVKSSFGKIIVGEASEEDMKDKDKSKSRSKSRTS